jgi:hypothetical protein
VPVLDSCQRQRVVRPAMGGEKNWRTFVPILNCWASRNREGSFSKPSETSLMGGTSASLWEEQQVYVRVRGHFHDGHIRQLLRPHKRLLTRV